MTERLTILRAATHETELGNHDFCLSRSHYTDTDPTSRRGRPQRVLQQRTFLRLISNNSNTQDILCSLKYPLSNLLKKNYTTI